MSLYDLARAVYADDFLAARGVLDRMAHSDFTVLRAKLAAGLPAGDAVIPVDDMAQRRLEAVTREEELLARKGELRVRNSGRPQVRYA